MWLAKPPHMHALRGTVVVLLGTLPWSSASASTFDPPPLASRFSQVLTVDAFAAGNTVVQDSWGNLQADTAVAVPPERHRAFSDLKPARDIGRGLRVLGSDTKAVVTAPFHMNAGDALWTGAT